MPDSCSGTVFSFHLDLHLWHLVEHISFQDHLSENMKLNHAKSIVRWAWQNSHLTRHIASEDRITLAHTVTKTSRKTGRTIRRPGKPRPSLTEKLSNLHLLLRVNTFARWPLEVRFLAPDVFGVWQRWSEKVEGSIRTGVKVFLDSKQHPATGPAAITDESRTTNSKTAANEKNLLGLGGIEAIDASYTYLKPRVEKSLARLNDQSNPKCSICSTAISTNHHSMTLVCPARDCNAISHLPCLSEHFLGTSPSNTLLPTGGTCPSCKTPLRWIDLVQEMTLRSRGEKELLKLLKPPREKQVKAPKRKRAKIGDLSEAIVLDSDDDSKRALEDGNDEDLLDNFSITDGPLDQDDVILQDAENSNDTMSSSDFELWESAELAATRPAKETHAGQSRKIAMIVEDSD